MFIDKIFHLTKKVIYITCFIFYREKKTTDLMMDIVKNEDGSIQLVPIQDKQKKKIKTKSQSSRKLLIKKVS